MSKGVIKLVVTIFLFIPFLNVSEITGKPVNIVYAYRSNSQSFARNVAFTRRTQSIKIAPPTIYISATPTPAWRRLDYSVLPTPRYGSSLVLNTTNDIALLFGGFYAPTGYFNDLWITDGLGWIQFQSENQPSKRAGASMAYDELEHKMVMFGGIGPDQTLLGDTWVFDGVDWIQQSPHDSPSARVGANMVYDAKRDFVILFGGVDDIHTKFPEPLNDMWTWDGDNWEQLFPDVLPAPRLNPNMVYDRARESVVLFGGGIGGGFLEDTWTWNGSDWIDAQPAIHPNGRADFGMAYDEKREQVILFGGQSFAYTDTTETWAWDGAMWTLLQVHQTPPDTLSYRAQLVYMPKLGSVILYNVLQETLAADGGLQTPERSDVWILEDRYYNYLPLVEH